jgi:hypothetical protein
MDDRTIEQHIEDWRCSLRGRSDDELLESVRREPGNSGWVQLKGCYLKELRDEIHRRGLAHTEAARTLDKRVIFLDDTPDRQSSDRTSSRLRPDPVRLAGPMTCRPFTGSATRAGPRVSAC